ncbi:hypothetical protein FKM82_004279 [Ascaphus truei]
MCSSGIVQHVIRTADLNIEKRVAITCLPSQHRPIGNVQGPSSIEPQCDPTTCLTCSVANVDDSVGPHLQVLINGQNVAYILDSCAAVTIVSKVMAALV